MAAINRYKYDGPVMEFDKIIVNRYKNSTYAVSEKQARNNLAYRFKKDSGRLPTANISLPGKLSMIP